MSEKRAWAKAGTAFLVEAKLNISTGGVGAFAEAAALCRERGLSIEAVVLANFGAKLGELAARHGLPPVKLLSRWTGYGEIWERRVELAADAARLKRDKDQGGDEPWLVEDAIHGEAQGAVRDSEWAKNIKVWTVNYARKSLALIKSLQSSLPATEVGSLLAASKDFGLLAMESEAAGRAAKALKKALGRKCSAEASLIADDVGVALSAMAKKSGFVDPSLEMKIVDDQDRFAPQKAYAAFLGPMRRVAEGFWGSTNTGGMDLGAAKLFESEERAKSYFEKGGFDSYALVEVDIRVGRVVSVNGAMDAHALRGELARHERSAIQAALDQAEIGELRARLAQLEGGPAKEGSDPVSKPPRARL